MADIAWSNTTPGDDMTASATDDQFRSDWTAFETGIEEFFYWTDGSAGSAGEMKLGSARLRSIATDLVLGKGPDGYLIWTRSAGGVAVPTETGPGEQGMWHAGSTQTQLAGHIQMLEHNTEPSNAPYTARWVMAEGQTQVSVDTNTITRVNIDLGVVYNGIPNVTATLNSASAVGPAAGTDPLGGTDYLLFGIDSVTSSAFSSEVSPVIAGALSEITMTIHWSSLGTINW